jgi:hypothetical protein
VNLTLQEHLLSRQRKQGPGRRQSRADVAVQLVAYTEQWRTCYHFYTSAGPDVFYDEFERRMDALLHPDYTDEEVHREVRNFGVTDNPVDQKLTLDEKGTGIQRNGDVYRPARPEAVLPAVLKMIYGPNPSFAIQLRLVRPKRSGKFNLPIYESFTKRITFWPTWALWFRFPGRCRSKPVLKQIDGTLNRIEPRRPNLKPATEKDLPSPRPAPSGQIQIVEYPNRNEQQPGSVWITWPAQLSLM